MPGQTFHSPAEKQQWYYVDIIWYYDSNILAYIYVFL